MRREEERTMAQIVADLTSDEAELVLVGLYLRLHQHGILNPDVAESARQKLNRAFTEAFQWDIMPERWGRTNKIRVSVTNQNRW